MKKNNLYFILFFFYLNCQSQNHNYKVIYWSNNDIKTTHYFHSDNTEYARVYGGTSKDDSVTFTKKRNDLIVNEFKYNDKQKKRLSKGNIKYINYYGKLSDIVVSKNAFSMDEVPVNKFNFIKKDLEIEGIARENCKYTNDRYSNCDFIFPKSNELPYWPNNSSVTSIKVKMEKGKLDEMQLQATYLDTPFTYIRKYYYNQNKIEKIITSIKDNTSTKSYEDKFLVYK